MDIIEKHLRNLYGKSCWGAKIGFGTVLQLEFGQPKLKIGRVTTFAKTIADAEELITSSRRQAYVYGEESLYFYSNSWSLELTGVSKISSSMGKTFVEQYLVWLNGQRLLEARLDDDQVMLKFDLGAILKATLKNDDFSTNDTFVFSASTGQCLTCRGDGTYCVVDSSDNLDDVEWLEMASYKNA